jgi:uncharacterized protein YecE (DUF72 family)
VVDEPQGFRSSTPPVVAAISPLALVRFHGHNAENYEKPNITAAERFRYLYAEEELKGWVEPIRRLAESADRVHVLMNNCYGDYGVRNAAIGRTASGSVTSTGVVTFIETFRFL